MSDPVHFDVLIIGAGISGIGAAVHLQDKQPGKRYVILEAREAIGGTWDLFRYPGIRSDSDLHTFCYAFKPWLQERSIADADSILRYIRETAAEHGVERNIRFGHKVHEARWSSEDGCWTIEAQRSLAADPVRFTADWLFCAGGYYRYDRAFNADLPGLDQYGGRVVHPQFWPEDLDYAGKRVVVIGSGATAVTIVPAMAERAAHVTMLQRTPTYVIALPAVDPLDERLRRWLGPERAHRVLRWKNVRLGRLFYNVSRRYPEQIRKLIRSGNVRALPEGYDVDTHFSPPYNPWDQRICVVPDGDLFRVIRSGRASVLTDRIETFTGTGIRLASGAELDADVVVTATGLEMVPFAGVSYIVDDRPVDLSETFTYKGLMLTGMPNFVYAVGYSNASWTLKVDLTCEHFCRLLTVMDERDYACAVPEGPGPRRSTRPLLPLTSGYVERAAHLFPKQGEAAPWALKMDYLYDRKLLLEGPVGDHMSFYARNSSRRGERRLSQMREVAKDAVPRERRLDAAGDVAVPGV